MSPEETGRLFRELGTISGQIGMVIEQVKGHERLDEERHKGLVDGQTSIGRRLDSLEKETASKLDEDDLEVITGKHDLASAQAKAVELEKQIQAGTRESRVEERKATAEAAKKLASRRKLVERILLMLIAGLLTLATEQAGKHFGGEDATKKKSPELRLPE